MTAPIEIITAHKSFPKPRKPKHPALPLKMMQLAFGSLGRIFPRWFAKVAFKFFITPQSRAKHRISDEVLEAAKISDLLVGKDMLKTYQWGSGQQTILLVHGWQSRGTGLRSFVPKLLEAGYQVVAFDAPAHGDSGGKQVNLVTFSGAIKALYYKYGNVKGIICHSFGGAATAYAFRKLDPSMSLEKFVMIGTPSRISYPVYNALNTMNAPPMVRKYFIEKLEEVADLKLEELTFEKINNQLKFDKVLVVHDKQDEQVNFEEGIKIVEHWEKAELQVTDGFGHFALMKNEEVIDRVTEFIKR